MSTPKIEAPQVQPQETSREAIAAQIEAVPKIYQTQADYGQRFAALDVANLQRFIPQLGQLSRAEAEQDIAFQREQFPTVPLAETALRDAMRGTDIAGERSGIKSDLEAAVSEYLSGEDPLTDVQRRNIVEDVRSAQLGRGQTGFGFSGFDEARQIEDLRRQMRQERLAARLQKVNVQNQLNLQELNTALSTAGRVPVTAGQAIPFQQPGQLVQNVSPSDIFGLTAANQQAQMQTNMFNAQQVNPFASFAGSVFGSALGGFTGGYGTGLGYRLGGG